MNTGLPASVLDARILVVDDHEPSARLAEASLGAAGHRFVTVSTDPAKARELHARHAFDAVLVELRLRDMDGLDFMRQLHAQSTDYPVPVIIVAAAIAHTDLALCAGACDFIVKPYRDGELSARVRNAIRLGHVGRESHARYHALVEQSVAGIYISTDGYFTYANPRFRAWLGHSMQELGSRPAIDFVVESDRPRVLEMRREREAGGVDHSGETLRFIRANGGVVYLDVSARMLVVDGRKSLFGVALNVTDRHAATQALEAANRRLDTLSRRLLDVQEEERRTLARELHDEVGQSLVGLNIALHRIESGVERSHRPIFSQCLEVTAMIHEQVREMSVQLHPPHLDQLGLADALRWLANRQARMTGMAVECTISGMDGVRLAASLQAACYRICQEALSNAVRHSNAQRVILELQAASGTVNVHVGDDGRGFDAELRRRSHNTAPSLGLTSMEERARHAGGRLEIESTPGVGTSVRATFPLFP
ncbi:MAG TPA: response regulator [Usitatibacter sp.]|jgi:two-component system sensor histidine kinase UhpB|nr:response regulator [Usitatibacter sp.]